MPGLCGSLPYLQVKVKKLPRANFNRKQSEIAMQKARVTKCPGKIWDRWNPFVTLLHAQRPNLKILLSPEHEIFNDECKVQRHCYDACNSFCKLSYKTPCFAGGLRLVPQVTLLKAYSMVKFPDVLVFLEVSWTKLDS